MNSLEKVFAEIGDEARLESLLTEFYKKMASDILLGFFFLNKNLKDIINQQKLFLLRSMGQRESYSGKSPRAAHRNIPPILKGHFDRRLKILRDTLTESGLSKESVEAWVSYEEEFRKGIVEEEGPLSKRRPR